MNKTWSKNLARLSLLVAGRFMKRPQTREYIWPLSCVHLVMMVFSVQLVIGGVARPSPFSLPPPLELRLPLHPPTQQD
jgi:hypothetical protein